MSGESWNQVFRALAAEMHGTRCCACGKPAVDAHHVLTVQHIRRHVPGCDEAVLADPRNALPVCRDCHANHHARSRPFGRELLKPCHREFADDHGLGWLLDRVYLPPLEKDEAA